MAGNRVVARFRDGKMVKGTTTDFLPTRAFFHVQEDAGPVSMIQHFELKAIFFVRDLVGDKHRRDRNEFEPGKHVSGRKIRVVFEDGEVLVGTTQGYQPGRPGFFVVPADDGANTERCFVISAATREVSLL